MKIGQIKKDIIEKHIQNGTIIQFIDEIRTQEREELEKKIDARQSLFDFVPQDEHGYKYIKASDLDIKALLKEQ